MFTRPCMLAFLAFAANLHDARASLCDHYKENKSAIHYDLLCMGKSEDVPAGATSSFAASFNMNATALPTQPTSVGVETIGSFVRTNEKIGPVFSLIKGFTRFGTGISTAGNNTFYGDDVVQRERGEGYVDHFRPHERAKSDVPNLNFGTSFALVDFSENTGLRLGTSIRFNRVTSTWGGGPALSFASPFVTLGAAATQERVSNGLGPIRFYTLSAAVRVSAFELEHAYLRNDSEFHQGPIRIYTLSTHFAKVILAAAWRTLDYYRPTDGAPLRNVQRHVTIQYLFSKSFAAGLLYNYIPGATSLGLQFYL